MHAGPDPGAIAEAAARLRRAGLVAFPTETVYGLGADALAPEAVRAVFRAKGRPTTNPLIVHVSGVEMARRVAASWPPEADRLARSFWPGPLTIVLPKSAAVPAEVTGGGPTVAVRCPDHPVALALIGAFGGPIVGPSANRSGSISPTTAAHVRAGLAGEDVFVLDGGPCRAGIESTVVSLVGSMATLLRAGPLSAAEIAEALGAPVETAAGVHVAPGAAPSPGMMSRHYAPLTPARLFDADEWPEALEEAKGPAIVLTHERTRVVVPPHLLLRMPMDAAGYASELYARLHEADARDAKLILIERPRGSGPLWDAVRDRLARACGSA